jgi:protochlorophyllide reductase
VKSDRGSERYECGGGSIEKKITLSWPRISDIFIIFVPGIVQIFPLFMKYVTGGYVGEEEAGERLAQVIDDPKCTKSGVYWSWNGGAQTVGFWSPDGKPKGAGGSGGEIFENKQSDAVRDMETAKKMWNLSREAVGLSKKEMFKGGKLEEA